MRHVSPTLLRSDPNPGQQFEYSHDERLIRMVARTSVGPQQRIDFTYDWQGRRIGKQVWNNVPDPTTEKYIYDGWNVVAQINGANQAVKSFLWGLDLPGSMQGAGGVGGLLAVNDKTAGIASFVCYDGNGNVAGLVNTAGTSMTAQYEYGPFGEIIRATGPACGTNPFRFSTKYQDDETDLLYYGYRYYNASTGRWLSRDPLGELGFETTRVGLWDLLGDGPALYGFLNNHPIARTDILGTVCLDPCGLAKAMGLDRLDLPEGAEPDAAGVICCGGRKYTCVWRPGGQTGATNKKAQELISNCLSYHEDNHHNDVVCPQCWFWPTREQFKIPVDPRRAECAAYTVHLKCLQNAFASNACGGDTECNRQLLREIVETSRKKNDYCSE